MVAILSSLMGTLIFFFLPHTAWATHAQDHRYAVSGYVNDAQGKPLSAVIVTIEHKGGEKKIATTDSEGFYEMAFHLHDHNVGDQVTVTAHGEEKKLAITFDPEDKFAVRQGRVDFGAVNKNRRWGWFYPVLAIMGGVGVYFALFAKRKKKKHPKKKK